MSIIKYILLFYQISFLKFYKNFIFQSLISLYHTSSLKAYHTVHRIVQFMKQPILVSQIQLFSFLFCFIVWQ